MSLQSFLSHWVVLIHLSPPEPLATHLLRLFRAPFVSGDGLLAMLNVAGPGEFHPIKGFYSPVPGRF